MLRTAGPPELTERCRAFGLRLRNDAFFSHTTAALLWGAPLPLRWERAASLHISVHRPESAPHARGIIGHSTDTSQTDVVARDGLRVSSPARTWLDLASMLGLEDLVAVGDYFINWSMPLTTTAALWGLLDEMGGHRGIRLARVAFPLLSDRAESRPESRLRVILELGGIRSPRINHTLVDSDTGKQVRPDFTFEDEKLIIEYQGDYHRTKHQWRLDMTRREKLQAEGWYVMEVNADDLHNPDELLRRIRAILSHRHFA